MHTVPPELLSEDGLEARAAELERRIAREWLRYAIVDRLVLGVPFIVVSVAYVATGAFSALALKIAAGVVFAISVALTLYWVYGRIRPLQRARVAPRGRGAVDRREAE